MPRARRKPFANWIARFSGVFGIFWRSGWLRMDNPRGLGTALKGTRYRDLWRFRVGAYRIVVEIDDERIRILVVRSAHRRDVYRS